MTNFRLRWRSRLFVTAVLLLGCFLTRSLWLAAVARAMDVSEQPRRSTDAVLVLGGGAETRPYVAAALVRAGLARKVLVPTNRLSRENREKLTPPEHSLVIGVLQTRGVSAEAIELLPTTVDSTRDEVEVLGTYLDTHATETVAVVTHDYHTRRTRMLLRTQLGDRANRVYFVAAPSDEFTQENWWRTEFGFLAYTSEILKLIVYAVRLDRWTQACLVLVMVGVIGRVVLKRRFRKATELTVSEPAGGGTNIATSSK